MKDPVKVFIAGEGPAELGRWGKTFVATDEEGFIEACLRRVRESGWEIVGGLRWKEIRKVKPGEHRSAEARNLRGVALAAQEAGAELLIVLRDTDGDAHRARVLRETAATIHKPALIVGLPDPRLEAWAAALLGDRDALGARRARAEAVFAKLGLDGKRREPLVACVRDEDIEALPADCPVRSFLKDVRDGLKR